MIIYKKGMALVMDVTKGCAMACTGCKINKNLIGLPSTEKLKEIHDACTSLSEMGVKMVEYELGPTDILSAANADEIFSSPLMQRTASLFSVLAVNVSMAYGDSLRYVELARKVSNFCEAPNIALQIPINLKHIDHDKYFSLVLRNIEVFKASVSKPVVEVIFTVIVDDLLTNRSLTEEDYHTVYERCAQLRGMGFGFDFVSHHGLKPIEDDACREDFINTMRKFNENFAKFAGERATEDDRRYSTIAKHNETAEVVFHEGDLYIRPGMREKSNLFHDNLKVPEITATSMLDKVFSIYNESIVLAESYDDCRDCIRRIDCSAKLIHQVMNIVKTDKCLIGLKGM